MMSRTAKKQSLLAILTVSLLSLGAGIALARGGSPDHDAKRADMMKKADTNGDGKLDDAERAAMRAARKAEHDAREKEMLAKYDRNRDGTLDDGERKALHADRAAEMFKSLDKDGDGKLSLAEFQAARPPRGPHGPHGRHGRGHGGPGRGDDRDDDR